MIRKGRRSRTTYQNLITALVMAHTVDALTLATFASIDVETGRAEEAALVAVPRDGHCLQESAGGGVLRLDGSVCL